MIGSLLYLIASCPDINNSVGVCSRYQADSKESHFAAVKRMIRYVNGTLNFGFWYFSDTNMNLTIFSNADWASNTHDRKSTSRGRFYIRNNLVSWYSKK